jgi:hypothetical protein
VSLTPPVSTYTVGALLLYHMWVPRTPLPFVAF